MIMSFLKSWFSRFRPEDDDDEPKKKRRRVQPSLALPSERERSKITLAPAKKKSKK